MTGKRSERDEVPMHSFPGSAPRTSRIPRQKCERIVRRARRLLRCCRASSTATGGQQDRHRGARSFETAPRGRCSDTFALPAPIDQVEAPQAPTFSWAAPPLRTISTSRILAGCQIE